MSVESYLQAKEEFLSGDYSVEDFFKQNNFVLEYAYCKLLEGNLQEAKAEFLKIAEQDFRADWAIKLISFIKQEVRELPSYFQIRNFLEIDLNLLIQAGQAQYVENIINSAELFYSVNPESYKFIARVMLNNDYPQIALLFLEQAKDKFYYDPEMHFMFANCYAKQGDVAKAKQSIRNCLNILPEYFPAIRLLEKLA